MFWPALSDKPTILMLSNLSELVREFSSDIGHCTVEVMTHSLSGSYLGNELENSIQSLKMIFINFCNLVIQTYLRIYHVSNII